MKAYCNATRVIAVHADDQIVDPSVYGEGVNVIHLPPGFVFERLGEHGDLARPKDEDIPPPRSVSPLQMRRALRAAGLWSKFEAFLDTQSDEVKESWEYALSFERTDPLLLAAASEMNLSAGAIDNLFRAAVGAPVPAPARPRRSTGA